MRPPIPYRFFPRNVKIIFYSQDTKNTCHVWKADSTTQRVWFVLITFSASLVKTELEDWRMEAAFMPLRTLPRPGRGRSLKSTICARWPKLEPHSKSHGIRFLPIWRCKSLIWLRSRPQVVGDGNFAVVRVCYSRVTRKEFAVKIIDKVKARHRHHHRHRLSDDCAVSAFYGLGHL